MSLSERILKMADPTGKGFDDLFEQEIPNHHTRKEAFWKLNDEFKDAVGEPRYKNYESYRQSRRKRLKKQAYEW